MDERAKDVGGIETSLLFQIVIDLEPPLHFGDGPLGKRVLYRAAGGTFAGPKLRGEVVSGGGDWALFRPDGSMSLDVRLTVKTDDGALVLMTYGGRWTTPVDVRTEMSDTARRHQIDPARYYFRTAPLFETGSAAHAWLNDVVCVGKGYLIEGGIAYNVFEIG